MPSFQYQSLTADGQIRSGTVAAADRAEVVRRLLDRGETATRIDAVADGRAAKPKQSGPRAALPRRGAQGALAGRIATLTGSGRPTISRSELATFVRELATAIEAGLPLMQSLRTVRRQAHGRAMPVILDHLIDRVEAGDPLYAAARDYGRPFDEMVVGMLRAADASGEMSEVMHQLADLLERSVELRREVTGATFYPMIVFALLIVSVVILVTVLVPRLIAPMAAQGAFEMPLPTAILISVADFFRAWWGMMVLAILGLVVGWTWWSASPANRLRSDRAKLRLPLIGRLLRDVAVARFTRTLGTLTAAGLPILDALRITKSTLGNTALIEAISAVEDQVTGGKAIAAPLERCGLFPPLLIQVVDLGERSGRLDQMLLHAAVAFDRQVNVSIKLFTKALPPLLLVIMASLGGFVLAAILLPMLELQSVVA